MVLLFCDGFDHYTTLSSKGWGGAPGANGGLSVTGAAARCGAAGVRGSDAWKGIYRTVPSHTSGIIGFAVRLNGSVIGVLCRVWEGYNTHLYVYSNELSRLVVSRGTTGSVLAATTFPVLRSGCWAYIELAYAISDTVGTYSLRVNGVVVLEGTAADTQNGGTGIIDGISIGGSESYGPGGSGSCDYDDFYICDTSGSVNNDFLGDVRVQSIFPSGAGATTQMTPSSGSNYACVDEADPNGDTDYVSETTAGEKDTYVFGNLTSTSGTVKGVQVLVNARKDDAGFRSIAPVYRPVSTDYDGTTVAVGDSYAYLSEITEVSPETSSAWTIDEINGAEFGVKLVV